MNTISRRAQCTAFASPAYGDITEVEANAKWNMGEPNPRRMGHADEYAKLALHIVDNDYLNGEDYLNDEVIRIDGAQRFGMK